MPPKRSLHPQFLLSVHLLSKSTPLKVLGCQCCQLYPSNFPKLQYLRTNKHFLNSKDKWLIRFFHFDTWCNKSWHHCRFFTSVPFLSWTILAPKLYRIKVSKLLYNTIWRKKVSHLKKSILLGNRNCRHISAVHQDVRWRKMLSKISFLGLRKLISQLFRDANTNNSIDLRQNMHYLAEVIKVSKLKKILF